MKHFVLSLGIGLLAACSSDSQQTEEQLENDINQNSENTSDDAANQNSGENGDDAENSDENRSNDADGQEADSSNGEADGEASAEAEASAATDPMDTPTDAIATGGDSGGGDSAAMAEAAPAAVPASETVASAAAAPSSAMPPSQLWDANRQVRYVKKDGTPIYPSTQTSSQPITRLQRGDHVVVLVHGGWAMLSDGAYIEESALSSTALPRSRKQNPWIPPSE